MKDGFRHEYKYFISGSAARLLKLRLPHVMDPDPNTGPCGRYTIRSLYFDDLRGSAFEEKVSGLRDRMKYRIRYYNYDDSVIKLECKEKVGGLTRKRAQSITREEALDLEACRVPAAAEGLMGELRLGCLLGGLRPRVLVDYDRVPFVCVDGNTRITIDENVRTRPYCARLFASPCAMQPVLEPDQVILEIKFDDFLPGYLAEALEDIPKIPVAVSKFVLCANLL